jgi:hypothetical protein
MEPWARDQHDWRGEGGGGGRQKRVRVDTHMRTRIRACRRGCARSFACWSVDHYVTCANLRAFLCLHACLSAYLRVCLPACVPICVPACLHASPLAYMPEDTPTCESACLRAWLQLCEQAVVLACLSAYLTAYMPACVPACMRACMRATYHIHMGFMPQQSSKRTISLVDHAIMIIRGELVTIQFCDHVLCIIIVVVQLKT